MNIIIRKTLFRSSLGMFLALYASITFATDPFCFSRPIEKPSFSEFKSGLTKELLEQTPKMYEAYKPFLNAKRSDNSLHAGSAVYAFDSFSPQDYFCIIGETDDTSNLLSRVEPDGGTVFILSHINHMNSDWGEITNITKRPSQDAFEYLDTNKVLSGCFFGPSKGQSWNGEPDEGCMDRNQVKRSTLYDARKSEFGEYQSMIENNPYSSIQVVYFGQQLAMNKSTNSLNTMLDLLLLREAFTTPFYKTSNSRPFVLDLSGNKHFHFSLSDSLLSWIGSRINSGLKEKSIEFLTSILSVLESQALTLNEIDRLPEGLSSRVLYETPEEQLVQNFMCSRARDENVKLLRERDQAQVYAYFFYSCGDAIKGKYDLSDAINQSTALQGHIESVQLKNLQVELSKAITDMTAAIVDQSTILNGIHEVTSKTYFEGKIEKLEATKKRLEDARKAGKFSLGKAFELSTSLVTAAGSISGGFAGIASVLDIIDFSSVKTAANGFHKNRKEFNASTDDISKGIQHGNSITGIIQGLAAQNELKEQITDINKLLVEVKKEYKSRLKRINNKNDALRKQYKNYLELSASHKSRLDKVSNNVLPVISSITGTHFTHQFHSVRTLKKDWLRQCNTAIRYLFSGNNVDSLANIVSQCNIDQNKTLVDFNGSIVTYLLDSPNTFPYYLQVRLD